MCEEIKSFKTESWCIVADEKERKRWGVEGKTIKEIDLM